MKTSTIYGREISERELSTITHALRVAADRFEEDAKTMRSALPEFQGAALAEQFTKQATESRALADALEE